MDKPAILAEDKVVEERCNGIAEVLGNHLRWLLQYTGIEPDPQGIVEVGEQYANLSEEDKDAICDYVDLLTVDARSWQ